MSIYSAGTDIGNAGTVKGSAANLTSLPAPSSANVGTAIAGMGYGDVGAYGFFWHANLDQNNETYNAGTNLSGSDLRWAGARTTTSTGYS